MCDTDEITPHTLLGDLIFFAHLVILFQQAISKIMKSKALFLKLYEENPNPANLDKIVDTLRRDGIIIYPTDTVYGIGCSIESRSAIDKIARIKGIKPGKERFSIIFDSLSQMSNYARIIPNPVFKMLKKTLPGPYTFIFHASSKLPKILNSPKKTFGARIPDHNIPRTIVRQLGTPIITTSIRDEDDVIEYSTDPELIHEKFNHLVDIVIDGGYGNNIPSTIIDVTDDIPQVLREGLGDISWM